QRREEHGGLTGAMGAQEEPAEGEQRRARACTRVTARERAYRCGQPPEMHARLRQVNADPRIAGTEGVGLLEERGGLAVASLAQHDLTESGQRRGIGRPLRDELPIRALGLWQSPEREQGAGPEHRLGRRRGENTVRSPLAESRGGEDRARRGIGRLQLLDAFGLSARLLEGAELDQRTTRTGADRDRLRSELLSG